MHMSLDVRGALKWPKAQLRRACGWIKREDGTRYTPEALRDALMDELAEGHEVIPMSDCPGFDFKTGCPGHPVSSRLRTAPVQPASDPTAAPAPPGAEAFASAKKAKGEQ